MSILKNINLDSIQRFFFYTLLLMIPISKAAIEICFPILLVTWLIQRFFKKDQISHWRQAASRPVLLLTGFYLLFNFISIIFSTNVGLSTAGFFRKTLEYILLFIISADIIRGQDVPKMSFRVVLASSLLIGLDCIFQEIVGYDLFRQHPLGAFSRMTGPYENPNDLGIYLLVVFPVALAFCFTKTRVHRLWKIALVLLLAGCLIRSMYVAGFGATLLGIIIFSVLQKRTRKILLILSIAMIGVAGVAQTVRDMQWKKFFVLADERGHATGLQDRLWMWGAGWGMLQENPWTGVGLNTFMHNYIDYHVGGQVMPRYAHNCYLQVAAEIGWPGLIAYVLLFMFMVIYWVSWIPRLTDPTLRLLCVGLAIGLFCFMLQSFVDTNFYAIRHSALFWTFSGLLSGILMNQKVAEKA